MREKRVTLKKLAYLINAQFPQWKAEIGRGQHCIEREWPGHTAVLSRRYVEGNQLAVTERKSPFRRVYVLNLAAWYARASDGVRWFQEQGGKLPG